MYAPDQDTRLSAYLRTMRIIVIALAMGILTFLVVAVVIRLQNPNQPVPDPPIITLTALGFAGLQLVLQAVVPNRMAAGVRRRIAAGQWPPPGMRASVPADDVGKLCILYQVRLILGAALAEGAAFFLLIAYLMEGQIISLAAAGVMLALVLARFPIRSGLEGWLSDQQEQLRQERMAG
jgi:hypothetical protein